jgi:hypothetical protein
MGDVLASNGSEVAVWDELRSVNVLKRYTHVSDYLTFGYVAVDNIIC